MERQRSFSFKSTRCLLFCFILSFSLILLSFLSFWVMKANPLAQQRQTHLQFSKPFFASSTLRPLNIQSLSGFSSNFSAHSVNNSNLSGAQLSKPQNPSGVVSKSNLTDSHFTEAQESPGFVNAFAHEGFEVEENESEASDDAEEVDMVEDSTAKAYAGISNLTIREERMVNGSSFGGKIEEKSIKGCDVSKGSWVFDESYPLYTNVSCLFIDEGFNCQRNGRLDNDYMKWRWQPEECDIPRFNATNMLELIRGKRLVFVGDSINRNQWESLLCLLMEAVKDQKKVYETHGRRITKERGNYVFRFVDYQCTVEFYVSHFLVHESKAKIGNKRRPTLRIDRIDRGSSRWRGADILIFNTGNWWSHSKTQAGINYYQEGSQVYPHIEASTALQRALKTWATWVDRHINSQKTQVFFRSSAPSHFRGGQWNTGGHCGEAIKPLDKTFIDQPQRDLIAMEVIKQIRTPVMFLNVTGLSAYRIDGHPSVYGSKFTKRYSSRIEDCSHWCLPGVPDAWNELLYYQLVSENQNNQYAI
ncbi:hypothetical protein Ancab_020347 [Ancistrocladus abbreviatus]